MDSNDITYEQIEAIQRSTSPTSRYLAAMLKRMDELGFPPNDQIRQDVSAAHGALHSLWIRLHYLKCKDQTGNQFTTQERPHDDRAVDQSDSGTSD